MRGIAAAAVSAHQRWRVLFQLARWLDRLMAALTVAVALVGAAGMLALEGSSPRNGQGFASCADALWWTAMLLTTIGSQSWPLTPESRILCVLLSLFSISVVGCLIAALATFFVGRGAVGKDDGTPRALDALRREALALRADLTRFPLPPGTLRPAADPMATASETSP